MRRKVISSATLMSIALSTMLSLSAIYSGIAIANADSVIATIPTGPSPQGIAVDPSHNKLYVADFGSNDVTIIDGSTNTAAGTISVGSRPFDATFDSNNGNVYVTNAGSNTVSVIDARLRVVVSNILVGTSPFPITFDAANNNIYVANAGSSNVNVIDDSKNAVVATVPVGIAPQGIAADSANNKVYVTVNGAIDVIDGSTNTLVASIKDPFSPIGISIDTNSGNIYVVNSAANMVAVIDPKTDEVITTIPLPVGSSAQGITFDSQNGNFYVANDGTNTVAVINGSTNKLINIIPVGPGPHFIAFNPANNDIYVSSITSVSVISTIPIQPTPPDTTITSAADGNGITITNGSTTFSSSIRFTFTATAGTNPIASFQCSLDNSPFSSCSSPAAFHNLAAGPHKFAVVAVDTKGSKDPNPAVFSWTILQHNTILTVNSIADKPWNTALTVTGKLTDSTTGSGIGGKTITFTGTGATNLGSATTNADGTFTASGITPNTIATGWTVQAHFAGDSLNNAANSPVATYNTLKHSSSLSLVISPSSIPAHGSYGISGTLTDTSISRGIASESITFTATSPITIGSTTTNTAGQYSASGLTAPTTSANYNIQSHFSGDSLYDAANSQVRTLSVTTPSVIVSGNTQTNTATNIAQNQQSVIQSITQQNVINANPIANSGASQSVIGGSKVTLNGMSSYSPNINNRIIAYGWTQLRTGVPITLVGANTATPTFTTPIVPTDTPLAFGLRVMDNHGSMSTNTAIAYVIVKHNISNTPVISSNSIIQPQKQQQLPVPTPHSPIIPNNNAISPHSQANSIRSTFPPQIGSANTQNTLPPGVP